MPKKLTTKELNELKYVSMADLCTRVKQYPDMNDKLRFATQYLLLHGTQKGKEDYSFAEATYIAQLAIVAASKIEKEKMGKLNEVFLKNNPQIVNPHVKNTKDDIPFELFLRNPYEYLKGYAQKNIKKIEDLNDKPPHEIALKNNYKNIVEDKLERSVFNDDVYDYLIDNNPIAIKLRTQMMLGGKDKLDEVVKKAQPSFFSKLFSTSSLASKNFLAVYDAFNNPKHAMYGDKEALKKASTEYLQYKFPGWTPRDVLPNIDEVRVDATQKAKLTLCVACLKTLELQEDFQDYFKDTVNEAYKVQGISFKDIEKSSLDQEEFQKGLIIDFDDDKDISYDEHDLNNNLIKEENSNEIKIDKKK